MSARLEPQASTPVRLRVRGRSWAPVPAARYGGGGGARMKRTIGRWLFMAIAIPLIAALVGMIADLVEERRGPDSKVAKGLRVGKQVLRPGS